jgi:hypothetical protein
MSPNRFGDKRPVTVTLVVIVLYALGVAQILLGIVGLFDRYESGVIGTGLAAATTIVAAGLILFGLFVIALASGVARGSRLSRTIVTVVLALSIALDALTVIGSSRVPVETVVEASVMALAILALWVPPASRYLRRP